ncbi:MAG: FAD:protein FMN transferase, partial [Chitinophagaceae bacterium]
MSRYQLQLIAGIILAYVITSFVPDPQIRRIQLRGRAQGTTYSIIYYADDTIVKSRQIDSLLNRIDQSLSIYKPGSLINRFNRSSAGATIDEHLLQVVSKSLEIYRRSQGLFDITVMPLTEAWGFGKHRDTVIPSDKKIQSILPCIGSHHLSLSGKRLSKDKSCTKIDVNGIAQGYSVDLLAALLDAGGIHNYVVELGGEIRVKGRKPGNELIKIGIESPSTDEMQTGLFKQILVIDSGAITTSGNYRKFYESGGRHISHLFDPKTGYSINNELIATTVFASDAITADGYDNALMNMGLSRAFEFLKNNEMGLEAYFI